MTSIRLYMDYQNVHLSVGEAFAPPGTPAFTTLIHPAKFADTLVARRASNGRKGRIEEVHVYRGQPSMQHEPEMASRNKAQAAEWSRDRRVTMHTRPLRYPRDWPNNKAKEKGVDVMLACDFVRAAIEYSADVLILASRDTDMVPALEMARELGSCTVEIATWQNCSRLRFPDRSSLWCSYMSGADYLASKDPRQY